MTARLTLTLAFLMLAGCRLGSHGMAPSDFATGVPIRSDKDVMAPAELIEILNQEIKAQKGPAKADVQSADEAALAAEATLPRHFLGLEVELIPKTQGVLLAPTRLEMQKGGGVIDLAEWLSGSFAGSFFLRLAARRTGDGSPDLSQLRVHYLSNTRQFDAGRESLGPGCHQLMDLTNYFKREISKAGVKLNTTDFRHLAAIGGTFFFSLFDGQAIHLASLTFEDSRRPDLSCR